jgi:hypothetical protein
LGHPKVSVGHRARRLLEGVQQHDEVARALIEDAVAGVREPDAELSQFTSDLRADGMVGRRRIWRTPVEVLLDERIELCCALGREGLDELVDGSVPSACR